MINSLAKQEQSIVEQSLYTAILKNSSISDKTKKDYRSDIKQYIDYCKTSNQFLLQIETLLSYRDFLKSKYSITSVNRKITAIKRAILQYAQGTLSPGRAGIVKTMLENVKTVRINQSEKEIKKEKVLSPIEIDKLQTSSSAVPEKIRLMIEFLSSTGCRIGEMIDIQIHSIKENGNYCAIQVIGKGNKMRTVRLKKELFYRIKKIYKGNKYLFETMHSKQYLIQYVSREIKKAGKKVLGKSIYPHMLRHSFATHKIAKTGKIKAVSQYLGHSSAAITLDMYVHETLSDEELFSNEAIIEDTRDNEAF